jgi:hypothetical protein
MIRTIETGSPTQLGTLQQEEVITIPSREKVVWLTPGQLETNWLQGGGGAAEAAGGLVVPGQLVYNGGNGGDEAHIPPHIVRGYN